MLPPEYLESLPDAVIELIQEMEDAILSKMAVRITKYGWTEQSQWETDRLEAVGVIRSDIVRILSKYTGQTEQAIQDAMADAGRETIRQDRKYYEAAGMWNEEAINREAMNKVINAGLQRTQGTFRNLTGTLAKETAKEFTRAMDSAWLAAATGTIDPQTAGRRAIKELCARGIQVISYPSKHREHVEVAVRRALVTGINQAAMAVQDELMDELDCDLVETTAHAGARPEHAVWQGKVFSRYGKTPGYPTLAAGTGYGTGAGLGGWNCRHSYQPFFPGYESAYSDDILKEYQRKTCTYNGKALTEYEASQQQRYFERGIRRWKREYTAMDAAGLDTTQAAVKLKQWREKEADFLRQTGRRRDSSRSQIGTFGRSEAGKATWQAKKNTLTDAAGHVIMKANRTDSKAAPGLITQVATAKGGVSRNYYDNSGQWTKQISNNDHGNPKQHPFGKNGEHAHDIVWKDGKIVSRRVRDLTDQERKDNSDIL